MAEQLTPAPSQTWQHLTANVTRPQPTRQTAPMTSRHTHPSRIPRNAWSQTRTSSRPPQARPATQPFSNNPPLLVISFQINATVTAMSMAATITAECRPVSRFALLTKIARAR